MSEFTNNAKIRVDNLTNYSKALLKSDKKKELLTKYNILDTIFLPEDVLPVFDNLFDAGININDIKIVSNKLFNILFKHFNDYVSYNYDKNSLIDYLIRDNKKVKQHLINSRKYLKDINKKLSSNIVDILIDVFLELQEFTQHYTVKENILFPEIENNWKYHKCVKLMWSFHDDIRKNIKNAINILKSKSIDIDLFNIYISKVYFNINTIIFREEKILYPVMLETINKDIFKKMLNQLAKEGLFYVKINNIVKTDDNLTDKSLKIKLDTGELTIEQLELIFTHLPVDITFVDNNNRVKYYSAPKHRIFPRTVGVIGRTVQNCHPHESVNVVNKIVESFKKGEKDIASFWIKMGKKYVLIKYFAVRDKNNTYKGVLEVSQEISDIQKIKGERKLLDW